MANDISSVLLNNLANALLFADVGNRDIFGRSQLVNYNTVIHIMASHAMITKKWFNIRRRLLQAKTLLLQSAYTAALRTLNPKIFQLPEITTLRRQKRSYTTTRQNILLDWKQIRKNRWIRQVARLHYDSFVKLYIVYIDT